MRRCSLRSRALRWLAGLRTCSPRTILAIGFGVFVIYAFPGYMSTDSVNQLVEARSRVFTDAHPPIMAAEWAVLDAMVAGPVLMLVVQGALFLLGLAAVLRSQLSARCAAVVAVGLLLFPPILTTMAVIWKDSQMAAYLVAGTACLLSPVRRRRVTGVTLIGAACAFRFNAAAAALPLIGLLFVWRPEAQGWRRYAAAGVAFGAACGAAFGVNRALTVSPAPVSPVSGLAVTDIVGVLAHTRDRSDGELRAVMREVPLRITAQIQATARARYSPRNSYWMLHGDDRMFEAPRTAREAAALRHAWRTVALDDKPAYLRHRWAVFAELLGLSDAPLWSPVYNAFVENAPQIERIQHQSTRSYLQRVAARRLTHLASATPVFRPYLYALLALALLGVCCRDRRTLALLLSGLLYELGFFPIASTPDVRYSHWMICCTCFAAVLLFVQRLRGQATPAEPASA